jgi:REP element-mobilizing transposase RayT
MLRPPRCLPQKYTVDIMLCCNSRQFLMVNGLERDVLLAVLKRAQEKVPHRLYGVFLMANHLNLLLRPGDASQLPKLTHWFSGYSAMALNRLAGAAGTFWRHDITLPRLPLSTTDECGIHSGISTPIQWQLECGETFMTL